MSSDVVEISDDLFDKPADDIIFRCISASPLQSFFLFAGAGSGKTRSLVEALKVIRNIKGEFFSLYGKQVGVITFTNKACDEIKRRLDFDELFKIATIHSFAWSLINNYHVDIKEWLRSSIKNDILELEEKEGKGRKASKASQDRMRAIESKSERLINLDNIKKFIYNPDGDNLEQNSLSHSEVIKITAFFLLHKPLMQEIFISRYPILLIDESQDTNANLMDAFLKIQSDFNNRFCLGIICDTMQRIYADGKIDLGQNLPIDWAKPAKVMNHRCSPRIVRLINKIRESVDDQQQRPRSDKPSGFVRLFIAPSGIDNKYLVENEMFNSMARLSKDNGWFDPEQQVKILILEHHMAASRLGFLPMWDALGHVSKLQTGLRAGTLPGVRFFSHLVCPIFNAIDADDRFILASIIKKNSKKFAKIFSQPHGSSSDVLASVRNDIDELRKIHSISSETSFMQILKMINETNLFVLPDVLKIFMGHIADNEIQSVDELDNEDELSSWRNFLNTPYSQIINYKRYIDGESMFDTHQGIKGLEFPRVAVIMDDSEARGFMFSYEKLFGTKFDAKPKEHGKDSSIDRTKRLFYVTCSRAEQSLALVAYSIDPFQVKMNVVRDGWFEEQEIELI